MISYDIVKYNHFKRGVLMEEFRFALKRYFLISLAYFFIGVTFGLLMKEAGYGTIWSFLSAIFIYGGDNTATVSRNFKKSYTYLNSRINFTTCKF